MIVTVDGFLRQLMEMPPDTKVAFTNGCFDILHAGHVKYLEEAKKSADVLVVGLNSDASVKHIKGPKRPINCFENRATVLNGLKAVDFVIKMDDLTPENLVNAILPDVLVKGEDWRNKGAIGSDTVIKNGGKVIFVPFVTNVSTTKIIDALVAKQADAADLKSVVS